MKITSIKTALQTQSREAAVAALCPTNPVNRILVADDDRDIREFCAARLIASGYRVDTVADGAAGWRALHAASYQPGSYDLLITDNNMPKLSGFELVKKLRSARMALPVILASGELPAVIRAAIASEVLPIMRSQWIQSLQISAALLKPFTADELLGTVKEVLNAAASANARMDFHRPGRDATRRGLTRSWNI